MAVLTTYIENIEMVMSSVSSDTKNQGSAIHTKVGILFGAFYEL